MIRALSLLSIALLSVSLTACGGSAGSGSGAPPSNAGQPTEEQPVRSTTSSTATSRSILLFYNPERNFQHYGIEIGEVLGQLASASDDPEDVLDGKAGGVVQYPGRNPKGSRVHVNPDGEINAHVLFSGGAQKFELPRGAPATLYQQSHREEDGGIRRIALSLTSNAPGLDWLSYGLWITDIPSGDSEIGVFVDDTYERAFPRTKIAALTGTATYTGDALGIYANISQSSEFQGQFELEADFDTDTVSGTIQIQKYIEPEVQGPLLDISLETASITEGRAGQPGGFFRGTTSSNPSGLAGYYGGKFYLDGDQPGAVAGTFGASSATESVLGIYYGEIE